MRPFGDNFLPGGNYESRSNQNSSFFERSLSPESQWSIKLRSTPTLQFYQTAPGIMTRCFPRKASSGKRIMMVVVQSEARHVILTSVIKWICKHQHLIVSASRPQSSWVGRTSTFYKGLLLDAFLFNGHRYEVHPLRFQELVGTRKVIQIDRVAFDPNRYVSLKNGNKNRNPIRT